MDLDALLAKANLHRDANENALAIELYNSLENEARLAGNTEMQKIALLEQAYIYSDKLKDHNKGAGLFALVEGLCLQDGDKANLLIAFYGQGVCYAGLGNQYGKALEKFEAAEALAIERGHQKIRYRSLAKMADICFQHAENYEKTLELLEPYELLCREQNDFAQLDATLRTRALCFEKLQRWQSALKAHEARYKLAEQRGVKQTMAFTLVEQGYILSKHLERFEQAYLCYNVAEPICREINDLENLRACLRSQAYLLRYSLKNYKEALKKFREFEQLSRETGNDTDLLDILGNLAWLHIEATGDYDAAMKISLEMESLAIRLGNKKEYVESLSKQVFIHRQWGENELAQQKKEKINAVR